MDSIFKRVDALFLKHGSHTFSETLRNNLDQSHLAGFIDYIQILINAKNSLMEKDNVEPAHLRLLEALTFQNPFTDDIEKNNEIVSDLVSAIVQLANKSNKKLKTATPAQGIYNYLLFFQD
jgi:hypothetical protein